MNDVVAMIAGKTVKELSPTGSTSNIEPILAVKGLATKGQTGRKLEQIDFELRPGEILGVTGSLAPANGAVPGTVGIEPLESGEIYIDGARININSPQPLSSTAWPVCLRIAIPTGSYPIWMWSETSPCPNWKMSVR